MMLFYNVKNISIYTNDNMPASLVGFIYMSPFIHKFLTATQYIAPLMANFDTKSGGTQSTVIFKQVGKSVPSLSVYSVMHSSCVTFCLFSRVSVHEPVLASVANGYTVHSPTYGQLRYHPGQCLGGVYSAIWWVRITRVLPCVTRVQLFAYSFFITLCIPTLLYVVF